MNSCWKCKAKVLAPLSVLAPLEVNFLLSCVFYLHFFCTINQIQSRGPCRFICPAIWAVRRAFLQIFECFCAVCIILKKSSKSKVEVPCAPSVLLSLLSNPIRSRATGVIGLLESIWNHLENISDFCLAILAHLRNKNEKKVFAIVNIFLSL